MQYTTLGRSDLRVSRICMGCMGFGDASAASIPGPSMKKHPAPSSAAALTGASIFDTAIAYQNGTSEQYLGRALRDFARRDEVVVATKFLPRINEEIEAGVSGQEHIRRMLDRSLRHLGMEYVDLSSITCGTGRRR